eukprot:15451358-Alexandrium_andersonii.AAC.1
MLCGLRRWTHERPNALFCPSGVPSETANSAPQGRRGRSAQGGGGRGCEGVHLLIGANSNLPGPHRSAVLHGHGAD